MTRSAPTNPAAGGAGRCLLLTPRGCDGPADLLRGLAERGVAVRRVGDAPSVMVALARERFAAVVLVEPPYMAASAALAQAVRRYHPTVSVWEYRAAARPRFQRYLSDNGAMTGVQAAGQVEPPAEAESKAREAQQEHETHEASPPPDADYGPTHRGASAEDVAELLGETSEADVPARGEAADEHDPESGRREGGLLAELTEEELSMLLADDDIEERSP